MIFLTIIPQKFTPQALHKIEPIMVKKMNIPQGFEPIISRNSFGGRNGPIYEKRVGDEKGDASDYLNPNWVRGFLSDERHANIAGVVHGGMLMTFADIVLSRAVLQVMEPPFVTMRMVNDFISPALIGSWVEGRARVLGLHDGICHVEGEVSARGKICLQIAGQFKKL